MIIKESQLRKIIKEEIESLERDLSADARIREVKKVANVGDVQAALNAKVPGQNLGIDSRWGDKTEAAWDSFIDTNYKPQSGQPTAEQIKSSWKQYAPQLGLPGTPQGALQFINSLSTPSTTAQPTGTQPARPSAAAPAQSSASETPRASTSSQNERLEAVKLLFNLRKKLDSKNDEQVKIVREVVRYLYRSLGSANNKIPGLESFSKFKLEEQEKNLVTQVNVFVQKI